jgi:hypothetical protein
MKPKAQPAVRKSSPERSEEQMLPQGWVQPTPGGPAMNMNAVSFLENALVDRLRSANTGNYDREDPFGYSGTGIQQMAGFGRALKGARGPGVMAYQNVPGLQGYDPNYRTPPLPEVPVRAMGEYLSQNPRGGIFDFEGIPTVAVPHVPEGRELNFLINYLRNYVKE